MNPHEFIFRYSSLVRLSLCGSSRFLLLLDSYSSITERCPDIFILEFAVITQNSLLHQWFQGILARKHNTTTIMFHRWDKFYFGLIRPQNKQPSSSLLVRPRDLQQTADEQQRSFLRAAAFPSQPLLSRCSALPWWRTREREQPVWEKRLAA